MSRSPDVVAEKEVTDYGLNPCKAPMPAHGVNTLPAQQSSALKGRCIVHPPMSTFCVGTSSCHSGCMGSHELAGYSVWAHEERVEE